MVPVQSSLTTIKWRQLKNYSCSGENQQSVYSPSFMHRFLLIIILSLAQVLVGWYRNRFGRKWTTGKNGEAVGKTRLDIGTKLGQ